MQARMPESIYSLFLYLYHPDFPSLAWETRRVYESSAWCWACMDIFGTSAQRPTFPGTFMGATVPTFVCSTKIKSAESVGRNYAEIYFIDEDVFRWRESRRSLSAWRKELWVLLTTCRLSSLWQRRTSITVLWLIISRYVVWPSIFECAKVEKISKRFSCWAISQKEKKDVYSN